VTAQLNFFAERIAMATTHNVITVSEDSGAMYFKDEASGTSETTIAVGDSVKWSAPDDDHSVVSDNVAPFDTLSPPLNNDIDQGDSYTHTFSSPGTFGYHCGIHGGDPTDETPMYGIIRVEDGS
jgi:plastocyanin